MQLNDGYVPVEKFGQDHWSMLGYIDSVSVEVAGFQVGFDGKMRQGRRHFRVMREQCPRPKRPGRVSYGVVMDNKYSTRLKGDEVVEGHDDWHCVQDMVAAGLLGVIRNGVIDSDADMEPGLTLTFTESGWQVAHRLRQHKVNGGNWRNFEV